MLEHFIGNVSILDFNSRASLPTASSQSLSTLNFKDPLIQEIFLHKQKRVSTFTRQWSGPKALAELEPIVEHNLRFAGQSDHAGLGSHKDRYFAKPSFSEIRTKTGEVLSDP